MLLVSSPPPPPPLANDRSRSTVVAAAAACSTGLALAINGGGGLQCRTYFRSCVLLVQSIAVVVVTLYTAAHARRTVDSYKEQAAAESILASFFSRLTVEN